MLFILGSVLISFEAKGILQQRITVHKLLLINSILHNVHLWHKQNRATDKNHVKVFSKINRDKLMAKIHFCAYFFFFQKNNKIHGRDNIFTSLGRPVETKIVITGTVHLVRNAFFFLSIFAFGLGWRLNYH